jgi:hypothetical protein
MHVDMRRVAATAARTALENGEPHSRKRSGLGAVAAGAMLAVAARVAVSKVPGLPHFEDLGQLSDQLRNRLIGSGLLTGEGQGLDDHESEGEEETDDREAAAQADGALDEDDQKNARGTPDEEYWDRMEALEAAELGNR